MSYAASAAWSRPVLSYCCIEHGQQCGVFLLGRITTVTIYKSGHLGRLRTVMACPHILQVMMA
jgi:hypothetical protein